MADPIQQHAIDTIFEKYYQTTDTIIDTEDGEVIHNSLNDAYQSGLTRGLADHPRYTRIDIEGREGCYAIFQKKPQSDIITTEVLTPGIELNIKTPADDFDMQMYSAESIYQFLEGGDPAIDELDRYMRPFEHLTSKKPPTEPPKPNPNPKSKPSLEQIAAEHSGVMNDKLPGDYSPIEYLEDMGELEYEISELALEGKEYIQKNEYGMAAMHLKDADYLQSIHDSLSHGEIKDAITVIEKMDTAGRDHIPVRLYKQIYRM